MVPAGPVTLGFGAKIAHNIRISDVHAGSSIGSSHRFGGPMVIKLKRAYEVPESGDGFRVLVDRLWPRGVSKSAARIDLWLKGIGPSTALRKWFGHDPSKWTTFRDRYFQELDENPEAVEQLMEHMQHGTVTLVYGAKDQERNDAVALKEYLESNRARS
jgi:uncharacterized protein YeaO (DUF488 family)